MMTIRSGDANLPIIRAKNALKIKLLTGMINVKINNFICK